MAKILLVDDEEHIRLLYAEELSEEGHKVFTVASGHNLLKRIEYLKPEAVVLDIRLADYNGLELLQEIRNHYHDQPVILCTAYDTYKDDQRSIAADYYVVKSIDLSGLKMAIEKATDGRHTSMRLIV
jgi:DNA-binding response OmpR family regulator